MLNFCGSIFTLITW